MTHEQFGPERDRTGKFWIAPDLGATALIPEEAVSEDDEATQAETDANTKSVSPATEPGVDRRYGPYGDVTHIHGIPPKFPPYGEFTD